MLVKCPTCDISFSASHVACPICNAFKTPRDARMSYLQMTAEERLHDGYDSERVRSDLEAGGFSDLEVEAILHKGHSYRRRENRRAAFIRLIAGIAMTCFGVGMLTAVALSLRQDSPVRIRRGFGAVLVGGLAFLGIGIFASLTGVLTLVTGNERGDNNSK